MVEKSKNVLDKKDTKDKKISNNKKRVKKEIKIEEPKKEKLILNEEFINKNVNFSLLEVIIIILVTGIVVSLSTGLIVYNNYDKISKSKSDDTSSEIKEFTESYNHIINSYNTSSEIKEFTESYKII